MGRRGRLYLPLDVTFFDDDRIVAAGDGGSLLYLAMCLRIKSLGTDGRLSEGQIARLGRPKWKPELQKLSDVQAVMWDAELSTWYVAAWFGHNEALSEIEKRRAADRARKASEAAEKAALAKSEASK